ncbi:hypothetical protein DL769_001757 [Monosporascus sp. CRB-8-3]|nr:hypothetical protein DL769_001757 [Monosporascus sp. CRB-8-3]
MQFTTGLVTLLIAASGAQALPGSSLEERQPRHIVHAVFYGAPDCNNGPIVGEQDFVQDQAGGVCMDVSASAQIHCTRVTVNNATIPLTFFRLQNCNPAGGNNFFSTVPGVTYPCQPGQMCEWTQIVERAQFGTP